MIREKTVYIYPNAICMKIGWLVIAEWRLNTSYLIFLVQHRSQSAESSATNAVK